LNLVCEKTIIKNAMKTIPICVGFPGFLQTSSNHVKHRNKLQERYIVEAFSEVFLLKIVKGLILE
jgi:hypothetical protein